MYLCRPACSSDNTPNCDNDDDDDDDDDDDSDASSVLTDSLEAHVRHSTPLNIHQQTHQTNNNKSSPKSFGKSVSLHLIADNALVHCMC